MFFFAVIGAIQIRDDDDDDQGYYVFAVVCLSVRRKTEKVVDEIWWIFFEGVGCVGSISWFDFGGDLDRDADTEVFVRKFHHCWMGQFYEFYW